MGRTVRVTDRGQHAFVVIDRRTLEDEHLSWAARGVIGYLLSKPDDWEIQVEDLRMRGDLGREGIYSLLKELERYGYLKRYRCRDARGHFRRVDITVFEVPVPDSPESAKPDTVQPDTGEPYPANPTLLSNKYTKEPVSQTPLPPRRRCRTRLMKSVVVVSLCFQNHSRTVKLRKHEESSQDFPMGSPNSFSTSSRLVWNRVRFITHRSLTSEVWSNGQSLETSHQKRASPSLRLANKEEPPRRLVNGLSYLHPPSRLPMKATPSFNG